MDDSRPDTVAAALVRARTVVDIAVAVGVRRIARVTIGEAASVDAAFFVRRLHGLGALSRAVR